MTFWQNDLRVCTIGYKLIRVQIEGVVSLNNLNFRTISKKMDINDTYETVLQKFISNGEITDCGLTVYEHLFNRKRVPLCFTLFRRNESSSAEIH